MVDDTTCIPGLSMEFSSNVHRVLQLLLCINCIMAWGPIQVQGLYQEPYLKFIKTYNEMCNNGNGCDAEQGMYCDERYRQCYKCSPCRDPYIYHESSLAFYVIDVCFRNGFCPNLCDATHNLGDSPRMNDSFCQMQQIPQRPDCQLTCSNGGTLDPKTCQCSCAQDWSGPDCSECSLVCANEGMLDASSCTCSCQAEWTGRNCSDCGLVSCDNGGALGLSLCQCTCINNWQGRTCTDCSLAQCDNGGYLDESKCWCLCQGQWTGTTCSEPVSDTWTGGSAEEDSPQKGHYWLIPLVLVVAVGACLISVFIIRRKCTVTKREGSDIEEGRHFLNGQFLVENATPESLSVKAKRSDSSRSKKPVRLVCQKKTETGLQESPPSYSQEMQWSPEGCVSHTFRGLEAATTYKLVLQKRHMGDRWEELTAAEHSTAYYRLSVVHNQDGHSATVSGLNQGKWNALEVCLCQHTQLDDRTWQSITPGTDTVKLNRIVPDQTYTVRAGVGTEGLQATFRCFAEGTLAGDASIQSRPDCSRTILDVLDNPSHVRSLQLEVRGDMSKLPWLLGQALGLDREDQRCLSQNKNHCLDTLADILRARDTDVPIHDLMAKLVQDKEAEYFLWKLARWTKDTEFNCHQCLKLLHQAHIKDAF